jgi:hypothetical protein
MGLGWWISCGSFLYLAWKFIKWAIIIFWPIFIPIVISMLIGIDPETWSETTWNIWIVISGIIGFASYRLRAVDN